MLIGNVEMIDDLQDVLDGWSPKQRRRFIREVKTSDKVTMSYPVSLVWIAIVSSVSIARAHDMLMGKAGEEAVRITRINVKTGIRETIPSATFRDDNA